MDRTPALYQTSLLPILSFYSTSITGKPIDRIKLVARTFCTELMAQYGEAGHF
jgi:hypothetical protein